MTRKLNRRHFVKSALTGGAAVSAGLGCTNLLRGQPGSPNGKLQCAFVGVGGKGWSDLAEIASSEKAAVVALCDVDRDHLAKAAAAHPQAKTYVDWRELLQQPGIDAVCVTTPDHSHAPVAVSAMHHGMHIYCQKPLTHSIHEARVMATLAAERKLVTQMGLQHHSLKFMKTGVKAVRDGLIGKATAIHGWTDRPIWPQSMRAAASRELVPKQLHWDNWLGVAPWRDYGKGYHPFSWRGWEDFGTGALGDMGCHTLDPAMTALQLGSPLELASNGMPPNGQSFPSNSVVYYVLPGNEHTAREIIPLTWYDGGNKPSTEAIGFAADWELPANGCVIVGTEGSIFISFDQLPILAPAARFANHKWEELPNVNHYHQWIDACHGVGKTSTPIDTYSGPLTETVLLGNVALRFPGAHLKWDAKSFRFPSYPDANQHLKRAYREGWKVDGLG